MPVPSPQQISYLNQFEGNKLDWMTTEIIYILKPRLHFPTKNSLYHAICLLLPCLAKFIKHCVLPIECNPEAYIIITIVLFLLASLIKTAFLLRF